MYGISVLFSSRVVRLCSVRFSSSESTKKLLEFLADMPKANSPRIAEAQRQRQNISKKSEKYAPSTVYLQVIGSGARGVPNTLYLFTDQKRYLFNCGECTQRLAHEHKVKLSRLDNIFITSKTWRNIGGLPGLSLTLQDVGVPNITLHGPAGLDELYHATRRFVVMKDMNVTMAKCSPSKDFEDSVMSVKYVFLGPNDNLLFPEKPAKKPRLETPDKGFEEFTHDDTDYYKSGSEFKSRRETEKVKVVKESKVSAEKNVSKSLKVLQDLENRSNCTVAYICTLKKRPGTLDLAKCVELGVKPGPMLGQLKNGVDVVLPDGTLVRSKQVKTPDDPGPVFIVMEVPELSYLKESEFAPHFDNPQNRPEDIPTVVVHLTPPSVFNHPTYRAFMAQFGPTTRHLVLNSQNSCLGSEAVHRTQHKLNLLDSEIFPLLRDASVPAVWNSSPPPSNNSPTTRGLEDLKNKIAVAQFQNIINMEASKEEQPSDVEGDPLEIFTARTLTMFHLRPKRQIDRSAEPKLHIQEYIQEPMDVDGFVASLEQFRHLVENMRYARTEPHKEFPKVVFLGTGSCIPSKTRNTSAIVVQIDENSSLLLDCGEGTFCQLVRFYGLKKVNSFLRTLKAVYISHLHADHHIGLVGILQARREAFEQINQTCEPVSLLAPGQIYAWLSVYDQQFERIKPYFTLIPNQNFLVEATPAFSSHDVPTAVLASMGVQNIQMCNVSHCPNAFGVAIQIDEKHKITYSGDTIPCDALVGIGADSTLLIHEATMEDELADEARVKMHSTTSQAIEIGSRMNARFTVLTHFSQRYARLPRLNPHMLNDNKAVGIAFDNMQVSFHDLEVLPHMYAPLQLMFAEHCVEMELKAKHRARQKQRRSTASPTNIPHHAIPDKERLRWVSPGCRVKSPGTPPCGTQREGTPSPFRLRQDVKGPAVTGLKVKRPRSTSVTPLNTSANTSPTRSQNSADSGSSKRRGCETIDVVTPRTMSESSYSSRDNAGVFKVKGTVPCGRVINIHTATAITGNGRVTPVSQKLWFKKVSLTADRTLPHSCLDVVTSVLVYIILWRVAHIASYFYFTASPCAVALTALAIVFWTATKEMTSESRSHVLISSKKRDEKSYVANSSGVKLQRPTSAITGEADNRSSHAQHKLIENKLQGQRITSKTRVDNRNSNIQNKLIEEKSHVSAPKAKPPRSPVTKIPIKLYSDHRFKERSNSAEKLKQQFCRDMPVYTTGRPNPLSHSSTKSFKPQLEDIKSSFVLLNKNQKEHFKSQKTKATTDKKVTVQQKKMEEIRRMALLDEVKNKFRSRAFKNDLRYEKIEGLNWISWG